MVPGRALGAQWVNLINYLWSGCAGVSPAKDGIHTRGKMLDGTLAEPGLSLRAMNLHFCAEPALSFRTAAGWV
jgi:hypothetical protein